jgi:hypothetical protein
MSLLSLVISFFILDSRCLDLNHLYAGSISLVFLLYGATKTVLGDFLKLLKICYFLIELIENHFWILLDNNKVSLIKIIVFYCSPYYLG